MRQRRANKNVPILTKDRLKDGLPKAILYLALFYLISALFGTGYGFIASVTVAAFGSKYSKRNTVGDILLLAASQMLVCALACAASLGIALRLILNAAFPLVWTGLRSSPFNNRGYFVGMITFVFIQLLPYQPAAADVMEAMAFATAILTVCLLVLRRIKPQEIEDDDIRDGLRAVANQLLSPDPDSGAVLALEHKLYRRSYNGHNVMHAFDGSEHVYYSFALVFQRAAYYFEDRTDIETDDMIICAKTELAQLLSRTADEMNHKDNRALIERAKHLLDKGEELPARFGTFYRNVLRLLSLALEEMTEGSSRKESFHLYRYANDLKNHLRINAFEMRFALRLSLVTTISFALMYLLDSEHSYWLALNAFVIIQPMYEDSVTRVQVRLAGSVLGCVVTYLAHMAFPDPTFMYAYFSVMIVCMYLATPGKWIQPLFATACAVSLASITLGGEAAVEYRLLYLGIAALIVFVINRFVFPSTQREKFRFYLRELYRMQGYYIYVLKISATKRVSLTTLHNSLVNFHMLAGEVRGYLSKCGSPSFCEDCGKLLLLLWRMVAEAEQMIALTHTETMSEKERETIASFAKRAGEVIKSGEGAKDIVLPKVLSVPFFNDLAKRYVENLKNLCDMKMKIEKYEDIK